MFVFTLQNHVDDSSLLCEVEIAVVESAMAGNARRYCWWKKSQTTTWDVWNPVKNGINYLSTGAGFQPSTVVTSGKGDVSKRPCFLLQTNTDQMRFFRYPQPLSQSVDWSESPSYPNRIDAFTFQIRFFEDGARSLKLTVCPWKRMVGRWIFFWEGLFSGALLNFGRVNSAIFVGTPIVSSYSFGKRMWQWMSSPTRLKTNFKISACCVCFPDLHQYKPCFLTIDPTLWCSQTKLVSAMVGHFQSLARGITATPCDNTLYIYIYMKLIHCIPVPLWSSI